MGTRCLFKRLLTHSAVEGRHKHKRRYSRWTGTYRLFRSSWQTDGARRARTALRRVATHQKRGRHSGATDLQAVQFGAWPGFQRTLRARTKWASVQRRFEWQFEYLDRSSRQMAPAGRENENRPCGKCTRSEPLQTVLTARGLRDPPRSLHLRSRRPRETGSDAHV